VVVVVGLTCTVWGLLVVGTVMGAAPPVMITDVALLKVTVRAADWPAVIVEALVERVTVGAGFAVTDTVAVAVAVPPAPVAFAV
jgi:hypothetical protein